MKLGIVGLPNVGKSTLFNALTRAGAQAANYPFCTIEPNVGVVPVPDPRLDVLERMHNAQKLTPAMIEFVDIAGLARGASRGEGLGNKFLAHIREVDAIVHVVRCFEDADVVHVEGNVDALRDIELIDLELLFADMESLQRRIDHTKKTAKSGEKALIEQVQWLEALYAHLEGGKPARAFAVDDLHTALFHSLFLLTAKPVLYAANISEDQLGLAEESLPQLAAVCARAREEGAQVLVVCARIEEEIVQMPEEERPAFLEVLGLAESGLDRLIKASYALLGLISFLTAGPKEVRAWTIPRGTRAAQAAGKIHTDFERGFIRAEIVAFDVLAECGSYAVAKERGLVRSEGREYPMADGDVTLFRFNV